MIISNEDVHKIKNYAEDVKDITKTVRNVNDLNMAIKDFEHSAFEIRQENSSLKYQLELKDDEISSLKSKLSNKDKIINKLQAEKERLKEQLQKFKGFWYGIMKRFQNKLGFGKNGHYKYVTDDLYKNGVFNNNEKEIATIYSRKIKAQYEINTSKIKKKNNMELK